MPNSPSYSAGSRPRVLINWQTFTDWGIPEDWKEPFKDAVINAYTFWDNVANVDCRFQFHGYTTLRAPDRDGDLVIIMDDNHGNRLASAFGVNQRRQMVLYRRDSNLMIINWVTHNANATEVDMQAVMMHEFGHCFGIHDHEPTNQHVTMFDPFHYMRTRPGPFPGDVSSLRALYPLYRRSLRLYASTDGGSNWVERPLPVITNVVNRNPAACSVNGIQILGFSGPDDTMSWIRSIGAQAIQFSNLTDVITQHGTALAANAFGSVLWAYVDMNDLGTIQILHSRDQGQTWSRVATPRGATSASTPGLAATMVEGIAVWILVWNGFNWDNPDEAGNVMYSISLNSAADSWSAPQPFEPSMAIKALAGVSVAAAPDNRICVSWAEAPHSLDGKNEIAVFHARVDERWSLTAVPSWPMSETTRLHPAVAFDTFADRFVMAYRGQDFNTSLHVRNPAGGPSPGKMIGPTISSAPAMTYIPERRELACWVTTP